MTAMSDFGEALMTQEQDASVMSLKRWILLMTSSTWL